jgi:hypothetical protein
MSTTTPTRPAPPSPAGPPSGGGRLRGLVTTRQVVSSLVLAVATALLILGLQDSVDGGSGTVRQSRPAAIVRVFPTEGAASLRQEPIGAQLADEFTGEIEVDAQPIPVDQTERPAPLTSGSSPAPRGLSGLNQVSFTPGPNQVIESLRPGPHVARILYWMKVGETRDQALAYSWTFTAS